MTLQQLQALDHSVSYASIVDALGDTPHTLKLVYVPHELAWTLDPADVHPIGRGIARVARYEDVDAPSKFESSMLDCWEETFRRWVKNHASRLNLDTISALRWCWMDDYFASKPIAHDLSCPKSRAFPFDYIEFRIYLEEQPTQKED